jgi:hypothetical protein
MALSASFATRPAAAGLHDHLKCYKARDAISLRATADLRPADDAPFDVDLGCSIKVRSKQVCFPVEKDLIQSNGVPLDVNVQELTNAFVCYAVKCPPAAPPESLQMSDQFGTRAFTRLRPATVCAPAILGTPVTTTTLPHGPPRQCTDASAPACDGTCGNPNFACVADGGACTCEGQEPFAVCGILAGVPDCYGLCSGSQSCIEVGGACQCAEVYE